MDAVIPARSGSKSIPHKNIRPFHHKPLLFHSIDFILPFPWIRHIYFTTDSPEYIQLVQSHYATWIEQKKIICILRPPELAQDLTTDLEVFQHVIQFLLQQSIPLPHSFLHLRPTFPIRKKEDFECLYHLWTLVQGSYDSLRSVIPCDLLPQKMYWIGDCLDPIPHKVLQPYFPQWYTISEPYNEPRQKFPTAFVHNGCYDVIKVDTLMHKQSMTGSKIFPFEMKPDQNYDIDTPQDWYHSEQEAMKIS